MSNQAKSFFEAIVILAVIIALSYCPVLRQDFVDVWQFVYTVSAAIGRWLF